MRAPAPPACPCASAVDSCVKGTSCMRSGGSRRAGGRSRRRSSRRCCCWSWTRTGGGGGVACHTWCSHMSHDVFSCCGHMSHRLLIERLVSDNSKLIMAIDAAHEYVPQTLPALVFCDNLNMYVSRIESSVGGEEGGNRAGAGGGGALSAMLSLPPSQRQGQTWRFPTPNSRRPGGGVSGGASSLSHAAPPGPPPSRRSSSAGRVRGGGP